jgi:hypothetical protein
MSGGNFVVVEISLKLLGVALHCTNINIKPSKNNNLQEIISTKITNILENNIPVVIRQTHLHTVYYVTNTYLNNPLQNLINIMK